MNLFAYIFELQPMFADFGIGAAIIGALVSTAAGTALSVLTRPKIPGQPDLAASSREVKEAEARMLPIRRQLEALARMGGKGMIATGNTKPIYETQQVQATDHRGIKLYETRYNNETGRMERMPVMVDQQVQVGEEPEMREVDFTGVGDADIAEKLNNEMARIQLAMSQKYGTQFVEQQREMLKLSDPDGYAARMKRYELVKRELEQAGKEERPVAEAVHQGIMDDLGLEGRLNTGQAANVDLTAESRGGWGDRGADAGAIKGVMETGPEAEQLANDRLRRSLLLKTSGVSPEDVARRREQQALANEAAFIGGRTPQAQFRNISSAQTGPVPIYSGPALPQFNQGAGQAGAQAAISGYQSQVGAQSNQVSTPLAGLGLALQAAGIYSNRRRT